MATAISLLFLEKQQYFLNKKPIPSEKWDDLWQEAHDMGFMVAGASQGALLQDLHSAVTKAITEGTTLAQFRKDFDEIVAKSGWEYNGLRNWRTRVIYDTNIRQAYNAGREAQMADPELRKLRPYGLYRHGDSVVPRPEHLAWDDKVIPLDDPWWGTHSPMNGWGCSCKKFTLSERDIEKRGLEITSGKDMPYNGTYTYVDKQGNKTEVPNGIDPGFAYRPGGYEQVRQYDDQLQQQIQDYPSFLRTAMRKNFEVLESPELATRFPVNKLEDLTPMLQDFAKLYPEYLPNGVMGVAETKASEPFFNFTDGRFFVSGVTTEGINPKAVLLDALKAIRTGEKLELVHEQVVAGFWHEIVHQQQMGFQKIVANEQVLAVAETVTEFIARHTYPRFIKALGTTAQFQNEIIHDSIGYQISTERFYSILEKLSINPKSMLAPLEIMNKQDMEVLTSNLVNLLATTGRDPKAIRATLENLYLKRKENSHFQTLVNKL